MQDLQAITPYKKLKAINLIREHGSCMRMGLIDQYWCEFVAETENNFKLLGTADWIKWLKAKLGV